MVSTSGTAKNEKLLGAITDKVHIQKIPTEPETSMKTISQHFVEIVSKRLVENKRVRRTLPIFGRLNIERQLPFLCVYRRPRKRNDFGTEHLIAGEASYLTIAGTRKLDEGLRLLIKGVVTILAQSFGSFLIVEIWTSAKTITEDESLVYKPEFKLFTPGTKSLSSTIDAFDNSLKRIKIRDQTALVDVVSSTKICPPGLPSLLSTSEMNQLRCGIIGIEVQPIHIDSETGEGFPLILRTLHRGLSKAFKRGFFEFTRSQTTLRPKHYMALGRRSMVKAVWEVDEKLAAVGDSFDFLLQITPMNIEAAWSAFKRKKCEAIPEFTYRRLPVDPLLAKRCLFNIPIERIEDPTITQLFRDQQNELDRKLTLLLDRETCRFLHGSIQLFGEVEPSLLLQAKKILNQFSSREPGLANDKLVNASTFASRAMREIELFRESYADMGSTVTISNEVAGLMVSRGHLFISNRLKIPASRIEALVAHEVGTHVLTYWNGRAQPFKQLYVGLAGYEELQEGLAVLAEYLVGGLSRSRLRVLAARVVAIHHMIDGASFIEVYRKLKRTYHFKQRVAFNITMRVFRGGGLTKDIVYLRGLVKLLNYLKDGGDLETLYVGKFSDSHVAIVKELQWRRVLVQPPLQPQHINSDQTNARLDRIRVGLSVLDLVERRVK